MIGRGRVDRLVKTLRLGKMRKNQLKNVKTKQIRPKTKNVAMSLPRRK